MRRQLSRHAHYLVAATDAARPVGFTCSWVGPGALGIVEDVFVHPDWRHRGIASVLVTAAVAAARERGAAEVIIAADPDDTPKDLYQHLGFAPFVVTRALNAPGEV